MDRNSALYDDDFYAWTQEQARLLRAGELSAIDTENIAEEIESLGRSDKREIDSRLTVLLAHLLKWQFQPAMRSTSWSGMIREQRRRIERVLQDSLSLRPAVPELLPQAYADAREDAAEETGLTLSAFPENCPFTPEEVLAQTFLPGAAEDKAAGAIPPERS
ncbi:MAG TPA: DUF29 domain-containing protein [Stellaceae bacterium]|nr:DUF29 domain-containing protein [Stellaceae bacterium]